MPSPSFQGGAGGRLIKIVFEMKKVYLAPQTEAIKLLGENAIMAVSPQGQGFILEHASGSGGGMG